MSACPLRTLSHAFQMPVSDNSIICRVVALSCEQSEHALQAASNGGIDPGIIVPAQPGELSPAPSPSPLNPLQKPNPFNLGDLLKNILNAPQKNESGFHLFEAKSADGVDEQGNALPGNRQKNQGRVGRL